MRPSVDAADRRYRILVIEDDIRLQRIVVRVFEHEGWLVDIAADGRAGLSAARSRPFDCLVIDRLLPELDGVSLIRALRADGDRTPMLMLTARGDRPDRVSGLDAGADDYLGKPFAFEELIARIRALIRRARSATAPATIEFLGMALDVDRSTVMRDGATIDLTARECAVLKTLALNQGRVLSRADLLTTAWEGETELLEENVDLYVHYLRRKLDRRGAKAADSVIRTVRGIGYALRTG